MFLCRGVLFGVRLYIIWLLSNAASIILKNTFVSGLGYFPMQLPLSQKTLSIYQLH